jgi:hypothetical protein
VTLVRERDGKTWTFTSADTNKSGEYFNFETSGFGVANCFIFRPDPASVGSYQRGDIFAVTLSGGIANKADGSPATVSYRTKFVSQADSDAASLPPTSGIVAVATSTRMTVPSSARVNRTLAFSGKRTPSSATGRVTISMTRLVHGVWRSAGAVRVSVARGKFVYRFKPRYRGRWRLVATYSGGTVGLTSYRASRSTVESLRVK